MTTYRICDTTTFLKMCKLAEKIGYNRQIDTRRLTADIDVEGTHVCTFSMLHEHIAGRLAEPHMRTMWMVKVENTMTPVELTLDIPMKVFQALPEYEMPKEGINS